ncbi:hypothetical protein TRVL_02068 [Trypanosoma vivax]|nr:hypothetical protein TRVL_02068 [Trypanosoma vivax]
MRQLYWSFRKQSVCGGIVELDNNKGESCLPQIKSAELCSCYSADSIRTLPRAVTALTRRTQQGECRYEFHELQIGTVTNAMLPPTRSKIIIVMYRGELQSVTFDPLPQFRRPFITGIVMAFVRQLPPVRRWKEQKRL